MRVFEHFQGIESLKKEEARWVRKSRWKSIQAVFGRFSIQVKTFASSLMKQAGSGWRLVEVAWLSRWNDLLGVKILIYVSLVGGRQVDWVGVGLICIASWWASSRNVSQKEANMSATYAMMKSDGRCFSPCFKQNLIRVHGDIFWEERALLPTLIARVEGRLALKEPFSIRV